MAWVQVKDGEISSVNLVPLSLTNILKIAKISTLLGSVIIDGKNVPLTEFAPAEVKAFDKALQALAEKLPKGAEIPEMTVEELRSKYSETKNS